MSRQATVGTVFLIATSLAACDARGAVLSVAKDGSAPFTEIQQAIAAASEGDTISIGPGSYTDHGPYVSSNSGLIVDTYVAITKSDLVFVGTDRDSVVIGPETPWTAESVEAAFYAHDPVRVSLHNLTIRNARVGLNWEGGGVVQNCAFVGSDEAVTMRSTYGVLFRDCEFLDFSSWGINFVGGSTGTVDVIDCVLDGIVRGVGINIQTSQSAVVDGVTVRNTRVGFQLEAFATGLFRSCRVEEIQNVGINFTGGSMGTVYDSFFGPDARVSAFMNTADARIENCTLSAGRENTLLFSGSFSSVINSCHIEGDGERTVWFQEGSYPGPTVTTLDLTNNYWGTTDSTEIANRIWDIENVPSTFARAVFIPFAHEPVGSAEASVGQVRGLFGGSKH